MRDLPDKYGTSFAFNTSDDIGQYESAPIIVLSWSFPFDIGDMNSVGQIQQCF
jgi:hypothetical protein